MKCSSLDSHFSQSGVEVGHWVWGRVAFQILVVTFVEIREVYHLVLQMSYQPLWHAALQTREENMELRGGIFIVKPRGKILPSTEPWTSRLMFSNSRWKAWDRVSTEEAVVAAIMRDQRGNLSKNSWRQWRTRRTSSLRRLEFWKANARERSEFLVQAKINRGNGKKKAGD